jgi:hypothetical protein
MKNKNFRNIILIALVAVAGFMITMYSCEKETIVPNAGETPEMLELKTFLPDPLPVTICGEVIRKKIVNANEETVGYAYMYNDAKKFYVIMQANDGNYFKDAFMATQADFNTFPLNSDGNPDFTNFRFKIEGKRLSNIRRFEIPLYRMKETKYISVMAQVRHERNADLEVKERAWVRGGRQYGESAEGSILIFNVQDCFTDTVPADNGKTPPIDVPVEGMAKPKPTSIPADKQ